MSHEHRILIKHPHYDSPQRVRADGYVVCAFGLDHTFELSTCGLSPDTWPSVFYLQAETLLRRVRNRNLNKLRR